MNDPVDDLAGNYGDPLDGDTIKFGKGLYYNTYEDSRPVPMRSEVTVKLSFDLDEITAGSEQEQQDAAIEIINLALQREPFGLGARLDVT